MIWVGICAYLVVGLVAGVACARYEYRNGEDAASAGAVGFFVLCFWPVVAVTACIGMLAKATTKE